MAFELGPVNQGDKITDQVILGTPGKIIDWAFKFKFFDIGRIKVFVLDEADIMIAQQGHHDQSIRLHKYATLLFHIPS